MIDHLKNKWVTVALVVVLLTSFGFAFTLAAPASAAEVKKLRLATFNPSLGLHADGLRYFAEEVKKQSNGNVEIEVVWGEVLAKAIEIPDAVRLGTADMGQVIVVYHPELFPFMCSSSLIRLIVDIPFTVDAGPKGLSIYHELAKEFPEVADEFRKRNQVQIDGVFSYPPEAMLSRKPVRTLADAKGWKIRSWGMVIPHVLKAMGATPVSMPSVEAYEGLTKGVLDGTTASYEILHRYRWYENAKYYCESIERVLAPMPIAYAITINLDRWQKLPPDAQKVMVKAGEAMTRKFSKDSYTTAGNYRQELTEKFGLTVTQVPDAEVKAIRAKVGPEVFEEYIKRMEASGHPTIRKVLQRHVDLWRK